jgi:hypothetical protein
MWILHKIPKAQCVLSDHMQVLQIFPYVMGILQKIM